MPTFTVSAACAPFGQMNGAETVPAAAVTAAVLMKSRLVILLMCLLSLMVVPVY
jgi:hypothetical protein